MGVFTKVALKLYPWPGPTTLPVEGNLPAYKVDLPDNIQIHTVAFPTGRPGQIAPIRSGMPESAISLTGNTICSAGILKLAMVKILTDPTKTLSDMEEWLKDPEIKKADRRNEI